MSENLVTQTSETLLSQSAANRIPVIFFGRLEMRKGICTFVEAIKRLNPHTKSQIQVYFIGKVVEMHRTRFGDLTSDRYIQQELPETISYKILSDLYSHEAIQFISGLDHAIVCLASHQENFPNTGLEMGQLPL
jgi:glycosyltransferase involved in cell wall biosynthesis